MNIVWLKRDLRLQDNEALFNAIQSEGKTLIIYIFEPILLENPHYSKRHFDFIKQSLEDLQSELLPFHTQILIVKGNVIDIFKKLIEILPIKKIFSHLETGLNVTFQRDLQLKKLLKKHSIDWIENSNNGVFRGISNRNTWKDEWTLYMNKSCFKFNPNGRTFLKYREIEEFELHFDLVDIKTNTSKVFQKGGRKTGLKYLSSFFTTRYLNYSKLISKPELARKSCSRLSPYIAWGNLSVREIYQISITKLKNSSNKRALLNFMSRLRWQAHFIQKFEMECSMEFEPINKGFIDLEQKTNAFYHSSWQNGTTGIPLVDASMRCLNETGYLNFRMRALLVSFYTHNLWQPWKNCAYHLAKMFLDFEPGIHYPQIQMQAGLTGINTIRVYNPIKNALEHDNEGEFVKKWIPELQKLPIQYVFEPWKMTQLEQEMYQFKIGKDYPFPIVDLDKTRKFAIEKLWNQKNKKITKLESKRILKKHTLPNRD